MAPSPDKLQGLINIVDSWCKKWGIQINILKTNIVHFRKKLKSKPRCSFKFKLGDQYIEYASEYKYLGCPIDEHLSLEPALSYTFKKANRALALLNHRSKCIGGFHFDTYSLLFNQLVSSIVMPNAGIWGHHKHTKLDSIQLQAMRFFLGVGKHCPTAGLFGEMAWIPYGFQIKYQVIRLWHRILCMNNNRIPSLILRWSLESPKDNWVTKARNLVNDLKLTQFDTHHFLSDAWEALAQSELTKWLQSVQSLSKNPTS